MIYDKDCHVRESVVAALRFLKGPEILTPIVAALNDKIYIVRFQAVKTLCELDLPGSFQLLRDHLRKETVDNIKKMIEESLGKMDTFVP